MLDFASSFDMLIERFRLGSSYSKSDAPPPPYYSKSSDPGHHTGGKDKPPLNLRSGGEDALETLSLFDTWFLVDDSESMSWSNHQRWYEVSPRQALYCIIIYSIVWTNRSPGS
jgi:hypothetical protein